MFRLTKRQRLEHPSSWMDCESIECVPSPLVAVKVNSSHNSNRTSNSDSQRKRTLPPGSKAYQSSATNQHVRTPVASLLTREIFLERLSKEITQPFQFALSIPRKRPKRKGNNSKGTTCSTCSKDESGESVAERKQQRSILRQRILCGFNEVTRALEGSAAATSTASSTSSSPPSPPPLPRLLLIVLAKDDVNPFLSSHIPVLASQTSTPLLVLPGTNTSQELGSIVGLRTVSALAFVEKQQAVKPVNTTGNDLVIHRAVDSFVDFIRTKLPVSP